MEGVPGKTPVRHSADGQGCVSSLDRFIEVAKPRLNKFGPPETEADNAFTLQELMARANLTEGSARRVIKDAVARGELKRLTRTFKTPKGTWDSRMCYSFIGGDNAAD